MANQHTDTIPYSDSVSHYRSCHCGCHACVLCCNPIRLLLQSLSYTPAILAILNESPALVRHCKPRFSPESIFMVEIQVHGNVGFKWSNHEGLYNHHLMIILKYYSGSFSNIHDTVPTLLDVLQHFSQ